VVGVLFIGKSKASKFVSVVLSCILRLYQVNIFLYLLKLVAVKVVVVARPHLHTFPTEVVFARSALHVVASLILFNRDPALGARAYLGVCGKPLRIFAFV